MQEQESQSAHQPVLLDESLDLLDPLLGRTFVDATLGPGGHSEAILERSRDSMVIGIDRDLEAIEIAKSRLARFGSRFQAVHGNFSDLRDLLIDEWRTGVDGIIADLGISSMQLDSPTRGFSFRFDAPLDMRLDQTSGEETAAAILATRSQNEIANIIYELGEERFSRRIARRIVEKRESGEPITTTKQLADLVEKAVRRKPGDKIHPATRTFQALRIAVNRELEIIQKFLEDSVEVLRTDGRLVVITFHSLEDRIVKQAFQRLAGKCLCPPRIPQCVCGAEKKVTILTKKPVIAGDQEISRNPRSRSAKLRALKKLN